jgi:LmbE family N-acetylglucosaminyl deacetylase
VRAASRSKILVLSPHPDDAAFSCGGLLRLWPHADVTIVSCFTRSGYAPRDVAHGDPNRVTTLRRREDEAYARRIGAGLVWLGFADTSCRHGLACDPCAYPDEEPGLAEALAERLASLLSEQAADWILCPLAVGDHRDHILVHDAVRRIESSASRLFYEDQPYGAWIGGPSQVEARARELADRVVPRKLELGNCLTQKLADVSLYASQTADSWMAGIGDYARDLSSGGGVAERLWAPADMTGAEFPFVS